MYDSLKQRGHRLIDEFMDFKMDRPFQLNIESIYQVIDKIESMGYDLSYNYDGRKYFYCFKMSDVDCGSYRHKSRIEALYLTLLFFINGYNAKNHPDRRWR